MEDIVAIELILENGERRYFMTWGRIQHVVDGGLVEALVLRHQDIFALGGRAVNARLCWSLQDAASQPYFYEALASFAGRPIPYGPQYQTWRQERAARMENGKELYFLGRPFPPKDIRDLIHDFWSPMPEGANTGYYQRIAQAMHAEGWLNRLFSPEIDSRRLRAVIRAADGSDDAMQLRTYLESLLTNERATTVVEAVRGLQRIGATDTLSKQRWLLSHSSSRVRKVVAEVLGG